MERRLAAVLAADMVGYSRLMAADEVGTIARQRAHRVALIDPKIRQFGGRIVKTTGDGMLVEFPSVVDAVQCAVEIQQSMPERERDRPEDQRIRYRLGINLGDIVIDGDDILGDGVNLAARLEGLAPPGGLCVSDVVRQNLLGKVAFDFTDLGEKALKNMERRVRVWSWQDVGSETPRPSLPAAAPALTDKPSIAVLPLANMSGDPEQEYFADGITEDLITELARFRSLHVIARNSSFTFKGQSVEIVEIGRKLGVAYVIEGSVRKAGGRVRVTAQLIEAQSGTHLWAERYDRSLEDVFAVQDEIVRSIVKMVAGRIEVTQRRRASLASDEQIAAYDCYLRGKAMGPGMSPEMDAEAQRWLTRAIELDPSNAEAYATLGLHVLIGWVAFWADDRPAAFARARELIEKALALDDASTRANWVLGEFHLFDRQYEKARFYLERATRLNPNDSESLSVMSMYHSAVGEHDKALELAQCAARVDPYDLKWLPWLSGVAHFCAREYAKAVECLERVELAIAEVAGWLAASYAMLGRQEDARAALEAFFQRNEANMARMPPRHLSAWADYWMANMPFREAADREHLFAALRKAGFPE